MEVFRIEGFVEDRYLGKVKRALAGLVLELKDQPVVNAVAVNDHRIAGLLSPPAKKRGPYKTNKAKKAKKPKIVKLRAKSGGTLWELFIQHLKEKNIKTIEPPIAYDFLRSIGRSKNSYTSMMKSAQKAGVIIGPGKGRRGPYQVANSQ